MRAFLATLGVLLTWASSGTGAWEIPRGATVHEFKTELRLAESEVPANAEGRTILYRNAQVLARYDWIRTGLRTRFGKPTQVESVFYPMSSFDVSLPGILFPEATTYFFVDDHPAFDRGNLPLKLEPIYRQKADDGLLVGGGSDTYVGNHILGEILKFLPGARIENVKLFYFDDERTYHFAANKALPTVHMEVSVRFAGALKKIVHFHGLVGPSPEEKADSYKEPWWFETLRQTKPEALIVKGQGQGQDLRVYDSVYLSWLSKRGGILVYDQLPATSALLAASAIQDKADVDLQEPYDTLAKMFGYSCTVHLVKYSDR